MTTVARRRPVGRGTARPRLLRARGMLRLRGVRGADDSPAGLLIEADAVVQRISKSACSCESVGLRFQDRIDRAARV